MLLAYKVGMWLLDQRNVVIIQPPRPCVSLVLIYRDYNPWRAFITVIIIFITQI
jgi:hypothetical protein